MTIKFRTPSATNSYWAASDGVRIYSSARNVLVYPYDFGLLAFIAQYGKPIPWPIDTNGKQTTASLQAVMTQYGITLPFA